jgi:hypothetical protein
MGTKKSKKWVSVSSSCPDVLVLSTGCASGRKPNQPLQAAPGSVLVLFLAFRVGAPDFHVSCRIHAYENSPIACGQPALFKPPVHVR